MRGKLKFILIALLSLLPLSLRAAGQEEGGIRVNDPNSPQNSEKLWDWATLEPQIRNLWAFSAAP